MLAPIIELRGNIRMGFPGALPCREVGILNRERRQRRHLAGRERFVERGELIDDRALARALRGGRLGGAVLDTFREEPLPPTSTLYDLPNVILTPHTSWSSSRVLDRSVDLFCDNLRRYAAGEPLLNVVDPSAGY